MNRWCLFFLLLFVAVLSHLRLDELTKAPKDTLHTDGNLVVLFLALSVISWKPDV